MMFGRRRWERCWSWRALFLPLVFALVVALGIVAAGPGGVALAVQTATEDDDEDENPYRPGLIGRYSAGDGAEHARLEEELSFDWGGLPPDRRLPPGPFTARYAGRLWTQSPGTYRLHVFAAGAVRLKLDGQTVLEAHSAEPCWLAAEPIELPFGYHPLAIEYRRDDEPARLALYWEGPQFGLEPLAGRWLFHDARATPLRDFMRGEQLVRALRCAACHDLPGEAAALRAPALDALAGNISRTWLVDWLRGGDLGAGAAVEAVESSPASRRMPHFAFQPAEAAAIAEALLAASVPPERVVAKVDKQPAKRDKKTAAPPPPSAAAGATLLRSLGCLACHREGELGSGGLFGGGDLAQVADKRPADFFARWLADPVRINRDHRMPTFALEADQIESLSLHLQTLHGPAPPAVGETAQAAGDGAQLLHQARCVACHALPESLAGEADRPRRRLAAQAIARDSDTCLSEPDRAGRRPGYRLDDADRRAIQVFLKGISGVADPPVVRTGRHLLVEQNCLACHARGASPGLAERLPAVAEADPSLSGLLPALVPPALTGVGDKLQDAALALALDAPQPPRRAWLHVRMPKFRLSRAETELLVRHFVEHDRVPQRDATAPHGAGSLSAALSTAALEAAGPRLVTADGFGCTSCHAIGKWTPQKVALNAQGTPLSNIGQRVRREWFDRWVRNPARIVPQMEMPSVQQSIRGVLDERLDEQLAAVWHVLNRPDFTPPSPSALRVVRRHNLPEERLPAAVLTDVIEVGGRPFVKPLVVGLDNRHNVLVDLATNRLAAWWIGDTARQQTRGKTWYWEAGMPQLLPVEKHVSDDPPPGVLGDLTLLRDQRRVAAVPQGQYITEIDALEHVDRGVRFWQRLRFGDGEATIGLVQEFSPLTSSEGESSGFRRRVAIGEAPGDARWELLALPGDVSLDAERCAATLTGARGVVQVSLADGPAARFEKTGRGAVVLLAGSSGEPPACELLYRSEAMPDRFPPLPQVDRSVARVDVPVVPGFEGVRLPITDEAMPTGLCWREDGTLVVASLEGRVWLGRDTDGDGLVDRLAPFSDELAAPYGVAAADGAIDVISKYGLLRLFDADGDGHAERFELLASGWGHTRDYHDWAVGLPRDAEGNYYVSLPCQQDDRSEAAAHLRGRAVRLVPRQPTADDPRRFSIDELAAGLRFPQGIALSPDEELFVTDNQGNYTPFNELNHVVRGARYGFINRLERERGLDPPFRSAAIEIPHPWTRSVNGICFLVPPPESNCQRAGEPFGPFTGHLVGCEYDTRRLVRMSLQRVGNDFQGAVYPFSREPVAGEETFEGPLACQVSPEGDLYVGSIRDSGWGGGSNTGSIVRLRWRGNLPPGIAEVRAMRGGFTIDFTAAVDPARAADAANYAIESYRRVPTPAYGGEDKDRRVEKIRSLAVADDARSVKLALGELREGFVYEFHLRNLADGERFFPDEAHYTLRRRVSQ